MSNMQTYAGKPIVKEIDNSTYVYPTVCFSFQEQRETLGIFHHENPFDFIFSIFMMQVILALSMSLLTYFILRPLRQPRFVCNILAGIILGPSVLGRNKAFSDAIFPDKGMLIFNTMVRFGMLFAIFLIAAKTETTMLLKAATRFWPLGIFSLFVPFAVTYYFSFFFENQLSGCTRNLNITFVCVALSVSYFPSVAQVLEDLDLLTTEFGQLALSSSMFLQMASLVSLFTGVIFTRETFVLSLAYLFTLCATICFAIFVIRPTMVLIMDKTPNGKPIQEVYIVGILVTTMLMAFITDTLWFDFLSGALLMGLIVPDDSTLSATLVEKSEFMITKFFKPLFYIQIGILADFSSLRDFENVTAFSALVVVAVLAKMIGTAWASLYLHIKPHYALLLGLILNFKGVVELTSFHRFRTRLKLDTQCYTALVFFSILFTGIFHPLVEIFYKPKLKLIAGYATSKCPKSLQVNPEADELRALACIYHEDGVHGIIALLEACNHRKTSPLCAYVVRSIDLVGGSSPSLTPYKTHNRPRKQNGSATCHIMQAFEKYSNTSNGHVTIQPFTMVAPYKIMHNIICNLVDERHVAFIVVPFHVDRMGVDNKQSCTSNALLQKHAPCTVGILLDRGLSFCKMPCRIVVLFVGGADDREALALAFRMARNPNVNLTLLRVFVKNENDDTKLDDLLVKRFRETNENNFIYCEEKVNNSFDMMDVIQFFGNKYDLALVGKNSNAVQIEKEMDQWIEHQELGVIGDILASSEFSDNKMSVLVVQHCK